MTNYVVFGDVVKAVEEGKHATKASWNNPEIFLFKDISKFHEIEPDYKGKDEPILLSAPGEPIKIYPNIKEEIESKDWIILEV